MRKLLRLTSLAVVLGVAIGALGQATPSGAFWRERALWREDGLAFEFLGQVENPTATSSIQYGYLYHIEGLDDAQIFAGLPNNESNALFTFYNDATTLSNVVHGKWRIITRTGTMTIYYDPAHNNAAFTSPTNPAPVGGVSQADRDTYRDGIPVLTATFRHQVIFEVVNTGLSTDTNLATRHFFVTFWHTITESNAFDLNGQTVRFGKRGDRYRISLVGGPDPTSSSPIGAPAKIAGYATLLGSK